MFQSEDELIEITHQKSVSIGSHTITHPILTNNGSGFTIPKFLDANGLVSSSNTDWVNAITQQSISNNTDLSYRKGTDKLSLYTQLSYSKDNGIQKYTYYDRINMRLNASYKLWKDKITIGENFLYSKFNEVKAKLPHIYARIYGSENCTGDIIFNSKNCTYAFDVKEDCLKNASTFPREMFAKSLDEGILIRPIGNTIYVMPPYILSTEEALQMGKSVQRALERVLA